MDETARLIVAALLMPKYLELYDCHAGPAATDGNEQAKRTNDALDRSLLVADLLIAKIEALTAQEEARREQFRASLVPTGGGE